MTTLEKDTLLILMAELRRLSAIEAKAVGVVNAARIVEGKPFSEYLTDLGKSIRDLQAVCSKAEQESPFPATQPTVRTRSGSVK